MMNLKLRIIPILFLLVIILIIPETATSQRPIPDTSIPLVSNVFFETDLRQALKDLSDEAGIPIIADNSVHGLVTIEFNETPLENVLKKILASGGFTFRKFEDYYLVGAAQPDNPSFPMLTLTKSYNPNYLEAEQIPALLSDYFHPYLRVNMLTNSLAITASPELITVIEKNIAEIDTPPVLISVEAVVTELSNEAKKELGLDWSWLGSSDNKTLGLKTNYNSISTDSSFVGRLVRKGINYQSFKYDLILELKALATDGKAKIRANPKITTLNGKEASIFIGSERYFSIVTGPVNYPYTRLEKIPAGITLTITPRVSDKNEITAAINCEVSEISAIGLSGLPLINKRSAKTEIRVKAGEIIAIGGLTQEFEVKKQKKIPFLGSIPILGYLFSHTQTETLEKEIAIFISPHIVTNTPQKDEDQE